MSERMKIQREREKAAVLSPVQSETSQRSPFVSQQDLDEAPPIVQEVLSSSGQPLDSETRAYMEPRFGHDFSQVRIHTDEQAVESAQAVNALAYTVDRDVVFGEGQYAPETQDGKRLLAHELTHVVQAGNNDTAGDLVIGQPGDTYEQEAEGAATHVVHGVSFAQTSEALVGGIQTNALSHTIRRSLLGGIVGGVVGAVAGAVGGFLLGGPVGAVVGGVGGLVGGALAGNALTTQSRGLTPDEIIYAKDIYRDSLDYSAITITKNSMFSAGASRTIGNTINLEDQYFDGDTMNLTEIGKFTLIHEMGHVWQYQHGGLTYIPDSLIAQYRAYRSTGSRDAAYDWREAVNAGLPWERWNPEQQAQAIEDYNIALRKSKEGTATPRDYQDLSTLEPYMEKVRNGEGAPGGPTQKVDTESSQTDAGTPQDAGLPGGI